MNNAKEHAVYRIRRVYRKGDLPKKYNGTFEIIDDHTQQAMAVCDLIGKAVFSTLVIQDQHQKTWQMKPNRKIMPSRWFVSDPSQNTAMQFNQKIMGKLINPLYKIALTLEDPEGKEIYRLVDPRTSIPDRVLGVCPHEWTIMSRDKPVAKLVWLKKQKKPAKGLFGKLRNFMTGSDRGIVSAGSAHALPAPVALGMILIFEELTDTSGG